MRCLGSIDINNITYPLAQLSDYSFIRSTEDFRWVYKDGSATQQYISSAGTDFIPILKPYPTTFGESAYKSFSNYRAKFEYWSYRNQSGPQDLRIGIRIDDEENTILSSGGWGYDDSYLRLYVSIVLDDANECGYIVYSYYVQGEHSEQYADGYGMSINGGNSTSGRIIYDIFGYNGGGAGSGYIGNSLLSNKKMVGYNVPTSSAEGTKTESVNEASATPVSGKPKSGNGFVRIKFLRDIDFFGFIEHMNESQADNRFEYIGANAGYSRISPDYTSHEIDFGDWANFPIFAKNKPYMVKTDGTADYQLSENDYTKKADGVTASDVSNTSYAGCGAFAWLPKIYQKQEISGNDRIVKFSFTKKDGFEAVGFKTRDSGQIQELEGVWIPMFYGSKQGPKLMSINNSEKPTYGITIGAFKDAIDAVSSRARFFGGAIRNVITDLLTMFARDADIQGYYGFGCMNTSASSWYPETTMPQNAVKGGGRFYTSHTGTELCKVFHSILNSQVLWQYDPYYKIVNGNFWVSPYYEYGVGNESNIIAPSATGYRRAKKYGLIDDYGQVPAECEDTSVYDVQPYYLYVANSGSDRYSVRGGNYSTRRRGFQTVTFDSNYSYTTWDRSASPMILPPVGYKPD